MNMLRVDAGIRPETTTTPDSVAGKGRAAFTRGLRELADWFDAHPEVPLPYFGAHPEPGHYTPTMSIYLSRNIQDEGDPRSNLAVIARAMGNAQKSANDRTGRMYVWRNFGGIALSASVERAEVCERVVVGATEVPKTVPDPVALAEIPMIEVIETVEEVEWRCSPLLAPDAPTDGAQ